VARFIVVIGAYDNGSRREEFMKPAAKKPQRCAICNVDRLTRSLGTAGQFLLQTALPSALSSPAARNAKGLGVPIFGYYADHPDEAEIFRATMRTSSLGVTDEIVRSLDTTPFDYSVDVGGADGALLHSLMKLNPKLRGAVLERPEVANAAAGAAADRGVADRAEALAGDFFEPPISICFASSYTIGTMPRPSRFSRIAGVP
jgi:hypothetical protein